MIAYKMYTNFKLNIINMYADKCGGAGEGRYNEDITSLSGNAISALIGY